MQGEASSAGTHCWLQRKPKWPIYAGRLIISWFKTPAFFAMESVFPTYVSSVNPPQNYKQLLELQTSKPEAVSVLE